MQINIHALNEQATIEQVIQQIPREITGVSNIRIVVVDDGSTDRTSERGRNAGAEILPLGRNRGLGRAFQAGVSDAIEHDMDVLVTIDGDGQFDAGLIGELISPVVTGKADMATCSRFKDPAVVPKMPWIKRMGNHMVASLVSNIARQVFCDVSCGFRAYNRECLLRLNLMGRFTYTHEVILELAFKGMHIVEVPLPVRGVRAHGKSRIASNVLAYGLRTTRIILGTLLNHRPHFFFGILSAVSLLFGILALVGGSITWFTEETFIKALMLSGGFFLGMSVLLLLFGLQARVVYRNQFLLENILYELRVRRRPEKPQ